MPRAALTSGKGLVTGANGYVAMWIVERLLKEGFAVRATVRAESRATHVRKTFHSYGDKLEIVAVEDITKAGAFDTAAVGVDAIVHAASPFHMTADHPDDIIQPAVHGTTRISRRVIVTASCASVLSVQPEPYVFSEDDWNELAIKESKEKAAAPHKYCASKTLAERVAWEFMKQHRAQLPWDLVVLNPPYVYGPMLHETNKPEHLNQSLDEFFQWVVEGKMDNRRAPA